MHKSRPFLIVLARGLKQLCACVHRCFAFRFSLFFAWPDETHLRGSAYGRRYSEERDDRAEEKKAGIAVCSASPTNRFCASYAIE